MKCSELAFYGALKGLMEMGLIYEKHDGEYVYFILEIGSEADDPERLQTIKTDICEGLFGLAMKIRRVPQTKI